MSHLIYVEKIHSVFCWEGKAWKRERGKAEEPKGPNYNGPGERMKA